MKLTINLDADLPNDLEPVLNLLGALNDALNSKQEQTVLPIKPFRVFPETPVPAAEASPEPSAPLSVVRDLVDALLSFTAKDDLIRVVDVEGLGWAVPGGVHDHPEWVDQSGAEHDIKCLLTNGDGKGVSVISVSLVDGGSVSGECLRNREDFLRFFGSGSWK